MAKEFQKASARQILKRRSERREAMSHAKPYSHSIVLGGFELMS